MSDIFQEVDEEVRRDKAAEFWKKYQNLILAAAAVIVLASAGFRYWQYERDKAAQAAGDQFEQALATVEAGKLDEAKAGLDKIAAEAPGGYRALAQLTAAGARAQSDPQGAIGAFDAISGYAAIDPLIRDAARLRAALLRVDIAGEQQKGEAALTSLSAAGGPDHRRPVFRFRRAPRRQADHRRRQQGRRPWARRRLRSLQPRPRRSDRLVRRAWRGAWRPL